MATGYTYKVSEGSEPSFETFTLRCARAMGACINQRDTQDEFPNPGLATPSTYYKERLVEAEQELDKIRNISDEDLFAEAFAEYKEARQHALDQIEKEKATLARYEEMLAQVRAWTPPTSAHTGLQDFMIEQLESSIKFDSMGSYYTDQLARLKEPTIENIDKYRVEKLKSAQKDYDYAKEHDQEDDEREFARQKWILDLFDSLKVDVVDDKVMPRVEI